MMGKPLTHTGLESDYTLDYPHNTTTLAAMKSPINLVTVSGKFAIILALLVS
jgi:hypothetical protein